MWLILNMDTETGEADAMADVVVVADSSSEDEKKHLATDASPAEEKARKTNGASRKRGSSAVLENDDSHERSNEGKDSKNEVQARHLRKRTSKVSYVEKEDDDLIDTNRRKTPSKKKAAKDKSTEDKVDGMKEEAPQDGVEDSPDTGDAAAADATGSRASRKAPKRRDAVDAETKEQKRLETKEQRRLAAEAAVRLKEVRLALGVHANQSAVRPWLRCLICYTRTTLRSFQNLIFMFLVCKAIYVRDPKILFFFLITARGLITLQ